MIEMRSTILIFAALTWGHAAAQTVDRPVRSVTDPGTVTTRQTITPAGVPTVFEGRVYAVAFGATGEELVVSHASGVYRLDWRGNRVLSRSPRRGRAALQGLAVNGSIYTAPAPDKKVQLFKDDKPFGAPLGDGLAGALSVQGNRAAVPLIYNNQLAIVDLTTGNLTAKISTGIAPFAATLSADGQVAYVTNWGGRLPTSGDLTAPTGMAATADRVVVDARGIASTGTVSRIDIATQKVTHSIPTGLHPTGLHWDLAASRLYVANGNSDSVTVIDTKTQAVVRTISLQPWAQKVNGIAPTALAVGQGSLYVACGGINAVLVLDANTGALRGAIPTAWYPSSLALSPDGKRLAVGSLLGAGSGWREKPSSRYVHANRGSVAVIDLPGASQLASYTTVVAENNHMTVVRPSTPRPGLKSQPIPERSGEASPIEHVVYIVKENRTYDQVFGDLAKGNGDPSLVMFGRDVTPNHHRLSEQFVTLDNFYATGGNSADGHQWVTQANETAYCLWPGYEGRSYPFDGTDPIAYASGGFLWDYALARQKTVRIYGEYAGRLAEPNSQRADLLQRWKAGEDVTKRWKTVAPIASMNKILAADFPAYTNAIPDVVRAQIFLKDVKQWEAAGKMPNLVIVQLPSDHTFGAAPGMSSPKAMVADNDLALGQVVEGLTKSKFWSKMAIFVVEDDAQNGVDHVDGHRTVALAISPYTKRGHVDSTFYSHQSMVKTIELILGLPTMSLFDLIAHDMRESFNDTPDLTPYASVEPAQSLFDTNPQLKALKGPARQAAIASAKMRWDVPDAVPTERLNRIVWGQIRGWTTPYPQPRNAVFAPITLDTDDDDEADDKRRRR